jgi:Grx4 family monothiol glutaredoxin
MAATCIIKQIGSVAEFDQHILDLPKECLAVIYFHSSWAEPCQKMALNLQKMLEHEKYPDTTPPKITFLAIEAEDLAEVSAREQYNIEFVPAIILQRNNEILDRVSNLNALRDAITSHTGLTGAGSADIANLPPRQQVTRPPVSTESRSALPDNGLSGPSTTNPSKEEPKEETKEELNDRLSQLVKAAPVMLFMKGTPSAPQCGFSRQTVAILREHGVKYGFFNILADDGVRQGLKEFSEWPTFPQVYVDGEFVGGLDIVSTADE